MFALGIRDRATMADSLHVASRGSEKVTSVAYTLVERRSVVSTNYRRNRKLSSSAPFTVVMSS